MALSIFCNVFVVLYDNWYTIIGRLIIMITEAHFEGLKVKLKVKFDFFFIKMAYYFLNLAWCELNEM